MNQTRTYLVSAVPSFPSSASQISLSLDLLLNVDGALGIVTMARKANDQIYVMNHDVPQYDIRDPLQALEFVSILPCVMAWASAVCQRSGLPL